MSSVNKRTILLALWLVILGGLFVVISYLNNLSNTSDTPQPETAPKISIAHLQKAWPQIVAHASAPPRGSATAAFTLVEFGDFQCPQCGKMRSLIEALIAQSGGKANLLFCQRPFPQDHKWATTSAEASLAAAAQGKFWPMYDALYSHQDDLEPGYYNGYAAQIGLNVPQFQNAVSSHRYLLAVTTDAKFADSLGITITPTLVVHENKTGRIAVYIGSSSKAPGAPEGYQGIMDFAATAPWRTTHSQ